MEGSRAMEKPVRYSKLLRLSALWFSALIVLGANAASAGDLDDAESAGKVGEGVDGYVHLVDENASADVKALVKEVNEKRREKYAIIAKKRGVPVEEVAALAGAKLVKSAPAGEYVLDSTGKWRKK
jgi:uncharacterized protein YdbL (DUF1318 family)